MTNPSCNPSDGTPMGGKQGLYLEDLSVGDVFRSREYLVEQDELVGFAARYDPQPFHTDEAAAADSLFRGLAASGWHTASITMRLLVECFPIDGGVVGLGAEISWPNPTRPGDRLRVESTITEIRESASRPDRGIATTETRTLNQNDQIVQIMVSRLMATRRRG
ncbi:MAG: MaoC family dehydratase [Lysobacteraceae bacterium]